MGFDFVVTIELPDGTKKQFLTNEPYRIGEVNNPYLKEGACKSSC